MSKLLAVGMLCVVVACSYSPQYLEPSLASASLLASSSTAPADGVTGVRLTLVLNLAGGARAVGVLASFSAEGAGAYAFSPVQAETDAAGQATTSVTSTQPGMARFIATIVLPNGVHLKSQGVVVSFTSESSTAASGPPDARLSSIVSDPNSLRAGEVATVSVMVNDANGVAVAGQNVSLAATGSSNVGVPAIGSTNLDGVFAVQYSSEKAEPKTFTATVGNVLITDDVVVTAGDPNPGLSRFSAAPDTVTADNISASYLTVTLFDDYRNIVQGVAVTFSSHGPNTFTPVSGATGSQGTLTATWRSTQAALKQVDASFFSGALNANVTFVGGFATQVLLIPTPAALTQGTYTSVGVSVVDIYNNPSSFFTGSLSLKFNDSTAQLGTTSYTFGASDQGMHTFVNAAMFAQTGNKLITATTSSNLTSSVTVPVATRNRNLVVWQSGLGTGQCLGIINSNNTPGAALSTMPCSFHSNQMVDMGADGSMRAMGLCMAPQNGNFDASSALTLALCDGSVQQTWTLNGNALQAAGNSSFCLDAGSAPAVAVAPCTSTIAQQWTPWEVGSQTTFISAISSWALDISNGNLSNGTTVDAITYNASPAQVLTLAADNTIRTGTNNTSHPFCIEVANANFVPGQSLDVRQCDGGIEQMWLQQGVTLRPQGNPKLCADVNTNIGTAIVVEACSGSPTQTFAVQPASAFYSYVEMSNSNECWTFNGPQGNANAIISSACTYSMQQKMEEITGPTNSVALRYPHGVYYFNPGSPLAAGNIVGTSATSVGWRPLASEDAWVYQSESEPTLAIDANGSSPGSVLTVQTFADNAEQSIYKWPMALQFSIQGTSQCLTTAKAPTAGVPVELSPCSIALGGRFIWEPDGSLQAGGLCMDAENQNAVLGAQVQLAVCDYSDRQRWQSALSLDQTTRIFNIEQTNLCLDSNGSTATGAPLTLQSCTQSSTPATQAFTVR